ncbi:MAG: hypothetical protein AVO35_12695 [Candidatus Aegiribacteria sp. MLS_C]|nr:MAG: hypothetical protein AVO35_12695 [Candidatus Aegiribacteria sp. MLS_C]
MNKKLLHFLENQGRKRGLSRRKAQTAVIYCRVSTKEQEEEGFGRDAQETQCKKYCREKGFEVLHVYREPGFTATQTHDRKEYMKMHRRCLRDERVGNIVVHSYDRYSADLEHVFIHLRELASVGVLVWDVMLDVDTSTSHGRHIQGERLVDAFYERDRGKERTSSSMQESLQQGYYLSYPPMGYLTKRGVEKREATLKLDPQKAPIVKWAFMQVYQGGVTLREVCDGVNARGLTTRYGNELSMQIFKNMLKKLLYTGYFWHYEEKKLKKATWPGLISFKVYEAVFEKVTGQKARKLVRRDDQWKYPLKRFLRCSECTYLTASAAKKGTYPYYHCQTKQKCNTVRVPPSIVHALFAFFLMGLVPKLGARELILAAVLDLNKKRKSDYESQKKSAKAKLASLASKKRQVRKKMLYDESVPNDICQEELDEIRRKEDSIKENLDLLGRKIYKEEDVLEFAKRVLDSLCAIWTISDLEDRQRLQNALFPKPDTLILDMDIGFVIPDSNKLFSGRMSHSFPEANPDYSFREFAEFMLESGSSPSDSWEHLDLKGEEEGSDG